MTKVSVIIPVYNEEATIITLLEKVNDQVVDTFEFEIIVIDDGSTDETVKLLKESQIFLANLSNAKRTEARELLYYPDLERRRVITSSFKMPT